MRLPLLIIALMIVVEILTDSYIYCAIGKRIRKPRCWRMLHVTVSILFTAGLLCPFLLPVRSGSDAQLRFVMWTLYSFLSVYISKLIWILFDLIAKIPELAGWFRLRSVSIAGGVAAAAVFCIMWWGALFNRFSIDVKEVSVEIASLPAEFDGYRIVQLSDLHVGTFGNDTTFVSEIVTTVNDLKPDLIVFTGDIVNRRSSELSPFALTLSRLHAPDGVLSILGNHDYGDYSEWPDERAKENNMKLLKRLNMLMGWRLLLNETQFINKGNDSIAVIGVENIGDAPFPVYGSLKQAYPDLSDSVTKILLTHNPAHWSDSISGHKDVNIQLSLSGHTHAMQMTIGSFSPAKYRYKNWGGLYADETTSNQLYVNIGEGTVGLPARIGATPEITVITLKKP